MIEPLTVDDARRELSRINARAIELRRFLRARTVTGLTRGQLSVAWAYVTAGSVELGAARVGMRAGDFRAQLRKACRKLDVDESGLAAVLREGVVL